MSVLGTIQRKGGNVFWEVLLRQKPSVIMSVKEQMNEHHKGNLYRLFRESLCFDEPLNMRYGIRILDIYYKTILPAEYKALPNLTTYQQLERYYADLSGVKTV